MLNQVTKPLVITNEVTLTSCGVVLQKKELPWEGPGKGKFTGLLEILVTNSQ